MKCLPVRVHLEVLEGKYALGRVFVTPYKIPAKTYLERSFKYVSRIYVQIFSQTQLFFLFIK